MAKTFQFDEYGSRQNPHCNACEELLADALDGLLSPADQIFFDHHTAGCVTCMEAYAQAQRGAAWLSMLKTNRPEPGASLVARILDETSEAKTGEAKTGEGNAAGADDLWEQAGREIVFPALPANLPAATPVLQFPRPATSNKVDKGRFARLTRIAFEPRLAMTAAMAFFSIALTMNLTGVRLDQMHASDLNPMNLKRTYYAANATAVRFYDNLRMVRVLESRVDDIRQSNADNRDIQPGAAPAAKPEQKPSGQPDQHPDEKKQQDAPRGSSRRESPLPAPTLLRSSLEADAGRRLPGSAHAVPASHLLKKEGGLA
jgi:hypothetical protein